jgi:hypothetical protein
MSYFWSLNIELEWITHTSSDSDEILAKSIQAKDKYQIKNCSYYNHIILHKSNIKMS